MIGCGPCQCLNHSKIFIRIHMLHCKSWNAIWELWSRKNTEQESRFISTVPRIFPYHVEAITYTTLEKKILLFLTYKKYLVITTSREQTFCIVQYLGEIKDLFCLSYCFFRSRKYKYLIDVWNCLVVSWDNWLVYSLYPFIDKAV